MNVVRPYKVIFTQLIEREYDVDARTPEEAETIAQMYFDEGESGVVTSVTQEEVEIYPYDRVE